MVTKTVCGRSARAFIAPSLTFVGNAPNTFAEQEASLRAVTRELESLSFAIGSMDAR
jgi:hypothetical protein